MPIQRYTLIAFGFCRSQSSVFQPENKKKKLRLLVTMDPDSKGATGMDKAIISRVAIILPTLLNSSFIYLQPRYNDRYT
jgi:hypothetical protein